jgi:hypothetical protein
VIFNHLYSTKANGYQALFAKSKLLIPLTILLSISFLHCKSVPNLGIIPADFETNVKGKLKSIAKKDLLNPENSTTTLFDYTFSGDVKQIFTTDASGDTTSQCVFYWNDEKNLDKDSTFLFSKGETEIKAREYLYEAGKLVEVIETTLPEYEVLIYKYAYSYDGNIEKVEIQKDFNGNYITLGKGDFQWEKGNLIALKDNLDIGQYEEYTYQYDGTDNYLNLFLETEFPLFRFDAAFLSKNNLVAMKSNFRNQLLKIDTEFGEENRPLKRTMTQLKGNQWQAVKNEVCAYWE